MQNYNEELFINITVPDSFKCPVENIVGPMIDPVINAAGFTYERRAIENWFKNNDTDPLTRTKLNKLLIPNIALKHSIDNWLESKNIVPIIKNDQYSPSIMNTDTSPYQPIFAISRESLTREEARWTLLRPISEPFGSAYNDWFRYDENKRNL